ncbi:MAG: DinB family protein [Anaerolineae bacterium]
MSNAEHMIAVFERDHWVVCQQANGLSHEDSLLQPPFRCNCFNWVLGHIVGGRDLVLAALGAPPVLSEEELVVYQRESEPLTDAERAVPLEKLLAALDETQFRLVNALKETSLETLAAVRNEERQQTLGDYITFLQWHETYHLGQLEILRQLAGTDDKII